MKKLLLASAVAALSVSAAQAAPTVYGKAFLTLDYHSGDIVKNERAQLNSKASRIGLKGSEALTANTDLVYKLEYGIDVDAGTVNVDQTGRIDNEPSKQFYARDTYLGLSNAEFGTIVAGRLTAIDSEVDFANVTNGGVLGGDGVLASFDAPRANNSFAYFSPDYNGAQFMAMYVMDENNSTDNLGRDAFGVAAKYEVDAMKVGASYIQAGDAKKVARVSGSYAITPVATVGALYQMTDLNTDDNENAFTISGEMATATPWTTYAQGDMVQNVEGIKDVDAYRVAVGGKYAFNKATTGHVYGAYKKNEIGKTSADGYGIGGGIEYKF